MGPWGYVIANSATNCQAVATVKYDEKPIYYAIIIARPDLHVSKFPDDTMGKSISFADVGSTSGWLIPTYYAKEVWKIDQKTFWKYNEGATHAANEIAVSAGQVDMATDFDRNRNTMIAAGNVKEGSNKIIWTSDPLPNDAIVLPVDAPRERSAQVQKTCGFGWFRRRSLPSTLSRGIWPASICKSSAPASPSSRIGSLGHGPRRSMRSRCLHYGLLKRWPWPLLGPHSLRCLRFRWRFSRAAILRRYQLCTIQRAGS
jgi:hypothetical protein